MNSGTNRLVIIAIVFLFVIIVAIILRKHVDEIHYTIDTEETLEKLYHAPAGITLEKAQTIIQEHNPNYQFVDIRNSEVYLNGHIPNSINIPASKLLDTKNKEILKHLENNSVIPVLYGSDLNDANAARLVMIQTGFQNVTILLGNYSYPITSMEPISPDPEKPAVNFADIMNQLSGTENNVAPRQQTPETITITPRKKKTAAEGGC